MRFGFCTIALIPQRIKASETSEMINQVLFGEVFTEIEKRGNFSKVILAHDGYEGWIDNKEIAFISELEYNEIISQKAYVLGEREKNLIISDKSEINVSTGASFYELNPDSNSFSHANNHYQITSPLKHSNTINIREEIVSTIMLFMNSPYLWGGRTPWGVDCSGLVQTVFRIYGINLPRDASMQINSGRNVEFVTEARVGDIAFFEDKKGKIIHVGIVSGANQIIHASGKVRTDRLDHQGIFNQNSKAYTHSLRIIKNVID